LLSSNWLEATHQLPRHLNFTPYVSLSLNKERRIKGGEVI